MKGDYKEMVINSLDLKNNLSSYIDSVLDFDEHFIVTTRKGNVVVLSEVEYNSMIETLYIMSQKGLVKRIKEGEREDISLMSSYKKSPKGL